ncbi:MAG: cryptochrome/photolyase family protein, partial [Cyclobacteriaceae bacterium]
MSDVITIFWLRRDLRLQDNHGLYQALTNHKTVLLLFIFDRDILDHLDDKKDARLEFLHRQLGELKQLVEEHGSSIYVAQGTPKKVFEKLLLDYRVEAVYANHDYEPYAIQRDQEISKLLKSHGSKLCTFKDQVIFEKNEVVKDDGKPYTVFTPYMRKWKERLRSKPISSYPSENHLGNLLKIALFPFPSLSSLGFQTTNSVFPPSDLNAPLIEKYHQTRDIPSVIGTSRLSVHLRFGTISIRAVTLKAIELNEKWLNELIWRNFYMMILWHFPKVVTEAFKPKYDLIEWRNHPLEFEAWCQGQTGYPIIDAGMRELNETGFMHNRVRMITASFLTKHLLI